MFTDPISDMLTRIRNGAAARKSEVAIPYSKLKHNLAKILEKEGFIAGISASEGAISAKQLVVKLKYSNGETVVSGIKRVSTPGKRIYVTSDRIPKSNGGMGVTILSTSKGLMTDREAKKQKFGGEVICQVW